MTDKAQELKETRALKPNWSLQWFRIKTFLWRFFGALLFEPKGDHKTYAVSLGRVLLMLVLSYLVYLWTNIFMGKELPMPAGLMEVFYVLAGYIFGGKVVEAARRR